MALVKCEECGKEINKDAEICPHCGKQKKQGNSFLKFIVIIFIVHCIGTIIDISKANSPYAIDTSTANSPSTKYANIQKEELMQKFSPGIEKYIEDITLEVNDYGYTATVYLNQVHNHTARIMGLGVVHAIINILIARGHNPYEQEIRVWAHVEKRVKGVTGQDMIAYYGRAFYNFGNDSIEWKTDRPF